MLLKRAAIALIVLFLLAVGGAFLFLRSALIASLPLLDGQAPVPGLLRPVTIERDDHGVPAIRAESEIDAMRALGFLHGQERFFQMDMARRVSAGELSAVLGPATVPFDRSQRDHLFRRRARQALPLLPADHQALFEAYAEGVNAGVADLGAAPPEYLMLRQVPEPWLPEDSLLVLYTMFGMLHYSTGDERMAGVMHDALPRELLEFLLPDASRHDAPLIEPIGRDPAEIYSPAPIPGPDIVDLRSGGWSPAAPPPAEARGMLDPFNRPALGSNAWVVDASRTVDGRAILANDMHLGIQVPNIWYRAALHWGDRRVVGVTLPGVPGVVAGSTGVIAWGFTNTTGDFEDYVIVERDAEDPDLYRTPDGAERVEIRKETIEVRGAAPETYEVAMTRWGPIVATDHRDRELALRWTAHDVQHVNLGILDMPEANSIEE
ncbi:MAG: penicillin acylase family protein, partial [Planctomycetota bacterium]|nr:penicillin acylase family protein [Planctomycetota bacterium]